MKVNFVVTPILFLIFSSGCLNSSRKSLSLTLQEKKVAALDNIPIGMPENEAFKIMQQIGFTCEKKGEFDTELLCKFRRHFAYQVKKC